MEEKKGLELPKIESYKDISSLGEVHQMMIELKKLEEEIIKFLVVLDISEKDGTQGLSKELLSAIKNKADQIEHVTDLINKLSKDDVKLKELGEKEEIGLEGTKKLFNDIWLKFNDIHLNILEKIENINEYNDDQEKGLSYLSAEIYFKIQEINQLIEDILNIQIL